MSHHPRPYLLHSYALTAPLCIACSGPVISANDPTYEPTNTSGTGLTDSATPVTDAPTATGGDPQNTSGVEITTAITTSADTSSSADSPLESSEGSSSGPASLCGNAVVDDDEQCDLGEAHNWDFGSCTSQCQSARCGDGLVFAGVETCDDAAANGTGYNQCDPVTCRLNARCGDSIVTPEFEECDGGGPDGSGEIEGVDATCRPGCTWDGRIVFISSVAFTGDLGGITGADLHCQNLAAAAHIDGHAGFRAWLSDADESPLDRLTPGPERLVMLSGVQIAENLDSMISQGAGDGIIVTEKRESLSNTVIWTNTAVTGELFSATEHCQNWTSNTKQSQARIGLNAIPKSPPDPWAEWSAEKHWTSRAFLGCSLKAHLYCIEDATP